jgi:release factor glutamine methyltransferase
VAMRSGGSIAGLLEEARRQLCTTSETPQLDAEVLLSFVLGCSRLHLVVHHATEVEVDFIVRFQELVHRRVRFEPVAYLTGTKEFFGLSFRVAPDVLIPRPDTEVLVEEAVRLLVAMDRRAHAEKNERGVTPEALRFLDLGTGSGCIAISVQHEVGRRGVSASGCGIDRCQRALTIAAENAECLGVPLELRHGSWFEPCKPWEAYDLILSNPPYINRVDKELSPETAYEPQQALFADECGLSDIRNILERAPAFLKPGGSILIEVGRGQAISVIERFAPSGFSGRIIADLAGIERVVVFKRLTEEI